MNGEAVAGAVASSAIIMLLITFVTYSIIPVILACTTKEPIENKRFQKNCLLANIIAFVISIVIGLSSTGGSLGYALGREIIPYLIWTAVGFCIGKSILKKKGLLLKDGEAVLIQQKAPNTAAAQDKVESLMNTYANKTDAELQGILSGGYTQEAKYAAKAILDRRRGMQQSQPYAGQQQSQPYAGQQQYGSYGSQPYSGNYGQQQYRAPQQPQQQYNGDMLSRSSTADIMPSLRAQSPKFCSRCGSPLNPGSRFCSNCGADMTK